MKDNPLVGTEVGVLVAGSDDDYFGTIVSVNQDRTELTIRVNQALTDEMHNLVGSPEQPALTNRDTTLLFSSLDAAREDVIVRTYLLGLVPTKQLIDDCVEQFIVEPHPGMFAWSPGADLNYWLFMHWRKPVSVPTG